MSVFRQLVSTIVLRILRFVAPRFWALTQYQIGSLHVSPTSSRRDLETAILHFERALAVFRQDHFPETWALVHNDLGVAYARLGGANHRMNLETALRHFGKALLVRTQEEHLFDWAGTQVNVGNTSLTMYRSVESEDTRLDDAIDAYERAFRAYSSLGRVEDAAKAQVGLANGYLCRYDRSGDNRHLDDAIANYEAAVESLTQQHPLHYATALLNLVAAYEKRGDRQSLEHAESTALEAAAILEPLGAPALWAGVLNNLGNVWSKLEKPDRAIGAFRAALTVRTPDADPLE